MATVWIKRLRSQLMISFVLVALLSVALSALGVILFAGQQARAFAEADLSQQLDSAARLAGFLNDANDRGRGPGGQRRAGVLRSSNIVSIGQDGAVSAVNPQSSFEIRALSQNQLDTLVAEEFIALDTQQVLEGGKEITGEVAGLRVIPGELFSGTDLEAPVFALFGTRSDAAFDSRIIRWFAVSALGAVLVSLLIAGWLARRVSNPITSIESTTARLSDGDLSARAKEVGPAEISSLATSVNSMASRLQSSKELDRQFLLSVSHDLRTPLTVIKGFGEALSDGSIANPQDCGAIISTNADQLERLVNDLLDLGRMDANRFELHPSEFELGDLINKTIAPLGVAAPHVALRTEPCQVTLLEDPNRVAQILANLASNALRYANSKVSVSAVVVGDRVQIDVVDDGPGIAAQDIEKVFDRFFQARSAPETTNSMGLGLPISKELAKAMGGDIICESDPPNGTNMRFWLPGSKLNG